MSNVDAQCRQCRRAGEKLFLKGEKCHSPKCPMVQRNFPPGVHGVKGPKRLTNYGRQLAEKQKTKRMYGLREKQFRTYFENALKKVGNTSENFFQILESRLDNTVYRLGFGTSRTQARQLVNHGHFRVNGKKVDIPSYQVKIGDVISLRPSSAKSSLFEGLDQKLADKNKDLVPWLTLDTASLEGKMTAKPKLGDVAVNIDWQMIVEFYSK